MSMRHYGVETRGLVMTRGELCDLILKNNNEVLRKYIDFDNIDDYEIDDFANLIDYTTWFYDIDGTLYNLDDWGQLQNYDENIIIITELRKDNLYEKYDNLDEIKQELKDNYNSIGIKLDDEFIEKHFGKFQGVYFG